MSSNSQINFNSSNMYHNRGYGRGVQNTFQSVSVSQPKVNLQTPLDKVSFRATERIQPKPRKEGLSTAAKWGLGALALTGIGATVYFFTRGKVGVKQAQKFAGHIEFKPAKTVEEAKTFANKTLNIQYLDENKANLDMLNTVNEWLYQEKFVTKNKIPNVVNFVETNIENPVSLTDKILFEGKEYNALGVNVNYIDKFDDLLNTVFEPHGNVNLSNLIRKNNKNLYEVVKPEYQCENIDKLVQKLNAYNKKSSFKDKMEIFDGISEAISYHNNIFAGKNVQMASFSDRTPFLHEMGHLHHQDTYKFWSEARDKTSEIYKDFKQRNIQSIAGEVSDYAKNDPLEFVAEVYAKCSKGQTFSDDVMALYKKYCGPALP